MSQTLFDAYFVHPQFYSLTTTTPTKNGKTETATLETTEETKETAMKATKERIIKD